MCPRRRGPRRDCARAGGLERSRRRGLRPRARQGRTARDDHALFAQSRHHSGRMIPSRHVGRRLRSCRTGVASVMSARQGAWDWRSEAAKVTAPVLTVHGTYDNLPIAASREWVQSFPDARLLLIEGAGHYPHFEQPDMFIASLATFFDGGWPSNATPP
ncbi:MAG TPA: alpha/beta fold hydrolase [Vicinamibacterales bacterium]|nr:alpha/beta fold hydrolase [Vicinamibacterales bacterium]